VVNATGPWIDFTNRGLAANPASSAAPGFPIVLDIPNGDGDRDEMIYFVNRMAASASSMRSMARSSPAPRISPRRIRRRSATKRKSTTFWRPCGWPFLPSAWTGRTWSSAFAASAPAVQRRPHAGPDQPRPQLPGGCLLATESISRSTRWWAASGPRSARLPSKLRTRFCGCWDDGASAIRRIFRSGRQGLPQDAGTHGTTSGAARYAAGALRHGRGQNRRLLKGGPGCAARLPRRLLPPGDRILTRYERVVHLDDLILRRTTDGLAGRGERTPAGGTGCQSWRRFSSGPSRTPRPRSSEPSNVGAGSRRDGGRAIEVVLQVRIDIAKHLVDARILFVISGFGSKRGQLTISRSDFRTSGKLRRPARQDCGANGERPRCAAAAAGNPNTSALSGSRDRCGYSRPRFSSHGLRRRRRLPPRRCGGGQRRRPPEWSA